ncbi:hypothetical protein MTR_3g088390 [Medicago truncatula]|uniref:Uncharacterized protein n=1 Tax=Medicago truncatula TaxID=3880 RepID=G7J4Y6_MEDTR|nr:hypothetical protein MTR_3g088390 [Medicago truncatula]
MVTLLRISDRLAQFGSFGGFSNCKWDTIQLIYFSTVWVLWKERYARIFKNKNDNIHHLLDNIKAQSFDWLKVKYNNLASDNHIWWLNHFNFS